MFPGTLSQRHMICDPIKKFLKIACLTFYVLSYSSDLRVLIISADRVVYRRAIIGG